jgi:hypothetical protein
MKNNLVLLFIFSLMGAGCFFTENNHSHPQLIAVEVSPKFVSLRDNHFVLEGEPFYPKIINFVVQLRFNDTEMWPAISASYCPNGTLPYNDRVSSLKDLQGHLNLAKEIGYNTVRFMGIGDPEIRNRSNGKMSFKASLGDNHDYPIYLQNENDYSTYLSAIDDLMKAAENAGLKVILTTRLFQEVPETEIHFIELTKRLKENTTLMAYDLFNEPLYFDSLERKKEDVYYITLKWQQIAKENDPNHLTTIGLANQRELFEWDPNLLNVDFISFHPYEFEKEQVRNEMYWYSRFVKKPWIIGETGIPADNDSVSYDEQAEFARKTIQQNFNCGGIGYSWWQFKDVAWNHFHQDFLGVISLHGTTKTRNGAIVNGTPKPVNKVIQSFDATQPKGACECFPNYYNFSNHDKFRVTGTMVDEDENPIEGGEILAWDAPWINHHVTTTKPDGTFELYSEYFFYHWMISAPFFERVRGEMNPDKAAIGSDGIPTIDLGQLKLKRVDIPELFN